MIDLKLSSLATLLATTGFRTESDQLIKLSGGAIAIPQKMYDDGVKLLRAVVATGLKKIFEDIPEKLARIEHDFAGFHKYGEFMASDITEFDVLSEEEKIAGGRYFDGDKNYILVSNNYLSLPFVDSDRFDSEYDVFPTRNVKIVYCVKDKYYSLFVDSESNNMSSKQLFDAGDKYRLAYDLLGTIEGIFEKWSGAVYSIIKETKDGLAKLDSLDSNGAPSDSSFTIWAGEPGGKRPNKMSPINTERNINGYTMSGIPVNLDGYKYFKKGIKYPTEMSVMIKFFNQNKDPTKPGADDFRWGYFSQGSIGGNSLRADYPLIHIGIPSRDLSIQYLGTGVSLIDRILNNVNDAVKTFGHELTHFSQYLIALNAGVERQLTTGKAQDPNYNSSGIITEPLKRRINPATGDLEWSLESRNKTRSFFGKDKPSDETMREILHRNESSTGLRLEHGSRDIEQKTRLYNEIAAFKKQIGSLEPQQFKAAFKRFVGYDESADSGSKDKQTINSTLRWHWFTKSNWITTLKANEPKKWKQVVLAMYQELSKDPDVML